MNLFQKIVVMLFVGGLVLLPYNSMVAQQNDAGATAADDAAYDYAVPTDTAMLRAYAVKPLQTQTYGELQQQYPMDLQPSNVQSEVVYDPNTGNYVFHTKVGEMDVATPFVMSGDEYQNYTQRTQMSQYFRAKNAEAQSNFEDKFNLADMKFSLGPAEKVFGPGGVQLKTQGSAELIFGIVTNKVDNPSMSERLRKTTTFDFDEKIQLNVNGKVGDKINFTMNYNTDATFEFDQQMLKLGYEGKEDEIIRKIEVGNVSMPLNSSLIRGSSSLFGFKADLQFGKLSISAVASQQKSSSQKVSSKGGSQRREFDVAIDKYDENRHFFLSQYFRDTYDQNMSKLPYITSGITINRIEVWVTNKRGNFDQARNILCFMDLAEGQTIDNAHWTASGARYPDNAANTLYNEIKSIPNIRDIQQFNNLMEGTYAGMGIEGGEDYEKIESARRLESSEYTLNSTLGFISLKTALNADEVLAVAYEYTLGGKTYQVGEFSTDGIESPDALMVKMLKSSAQSPSNAMWQLMMKNVYYLGAMNIQADNFELNVQYQNDTTGTYLNYLSEGNVKNKLLLKVMNLDRLDARQEARPDGKFDYVEGYTVQSSTGRIIFPVVEPFGSHLRKAIGNDAIADKYVFQELYDSTLVVAGELTEKNKFRLTGKYQSSSGSEIQLGAMNVPRGSVVVTAGGATLTENVDYTVDYTMGTVTILNESILASGTSVDVSLENQSLFNTQRKTLVGTHLEYAFNEKFSLGGTVMHLSEMPLVTKTEVGNEPIANTIWGVNAAYRDEAPWLTKAIDALPLLNATAPSNIALSGEFAHLIPGHRKVDNNPGYAYLDDFESTETGIDLRYPYYWHLASTPYDPSAGALFPEAALSNNTDYGKNRALFSWFSIDNSVFNLNNSTTPEHIRKDPDLQSNHLTRAVREQELFPNRESLMGQSSYLPVLNLSFYPDERGPYNMDVAGMDMTTGKLQNPEKRWGGMMRKLETSDFETANIEYLEFWLMDPFVYDTLGTAQGGDLYFNLGDVSEDILKDGKKFFENGMPIDGDTTQTDATVWGRVPRKQSMVLAFDNSAGAREYQDVGLNGLRTDDEFAFPTYKNYVETLRNALTPTALAAFESDLFSPLNDPAGDNFHHYRGSDYDAAEVGIIERYKHYCGPEGNSPASDAGTETYSVSATTVPDVEDINQDNTLNEYEKYYQYRVSLRPAAMEVGNNFITDKIVAHVELENGKTEDVTWYQFKIPIREYEKKVGSIRDFKSVRFMRMFMHGFTEPTFLRFGTLELIRGEWRSYTKPLYDPTNPPSTVGTMNVSSVSIEENNKKTPVNYVLPPGVTRETDPSQPQLTQENEQSMVVRVYDLAPGDARAVYKNISMDMRQYRRLQMFTHAEHMLDDMGELNDYELSVFIRLGSDYQNNYYEYEIPLKLTPEGIYSSSETDAKIVWPESNMFDFPLELLTNIKNNRNAQKNQGGSVSYTKAYSEFDPDKPKNKVTIVGNPSLGDVQTIMIGVRNQGREVKTGEVWLDELRLTDYNEDGGWAVMGNASIGLSDIGNFNLSVRHETAGFGGIEENLLQRRMDDLTQLNVSAAFEFGRFFPEKANVHIPLYFSYSLENSKPQYNPLDGDILLDDALDALETKTERDSLLRLAETKTVNKSVNLTNVKVDIKTASRPRVYDPANFSASYAYTETQELDPETERDVTLQHRGTLSYNFSTTPSPWEPFKNVKAFQKPAWRLFKDFGINYEPSVLAFSTTMNRRYSETQLRDLEGSMELNYYDVNNSLLSSSKDFVWDRQFELKYDLTKNLKFHLTTAFNARIDETKNTPVNREFFPDEYENWKDTVLQSMAHFGRPLTYQQVFNASYSVPFSKMPIFDWITANGQYNVTYNWNRGAELDDNVTLGNEVSNLANWQVDGQMNFEKLYNKSKYLKDINTRYSSNRNNTRRGGANNRFKPKNETLTLNIEKGQSVELKHKLNSKLLKIEITDTLGKTVKVPYTIVDNNTIRFTGKASMTNLKVALQTTDPNQVSPAKKAGELSVRFLMLIRRLSVSYRETSTLALPSFFADAGFMGQSANNGVLAPGLDFAFGVPRRDYLERAAERGWIVMNDSIINPASQSFTSDFDVKLNLEPLPGLKIDLNSKRVSTDQTSIQYMYSDMPTTFTGTFRMTHAAILTSFWHTGDASENYASRAFEQFKQNRAYVASTLQQRYKGTKYPTTGFMADNELKGKTYDAANGTYSQNSPDVLIPAFLAAYTGRDIAKADLSPFPAFWNLIPNWKISYDGLTRIPWVQKYFKSVTLNHAYQCTYNVAAYTSFANYAENEDGFGFVRDVTSGNPIPSSQYDISSVTINESFAPFLALDVAMKNSFTGKFEYRKQRTLSLNLNSNQLIESTNDEWVVGLGYVVKDFDVVLKLKKKTTTVKNDLTTRIDFSFKDIKTIIRKIDNDDVQPTTGTKMMTIKLTADYVFSSKLNLRLFYDYQMSKPLISTSYPISTSNVGFSIKFMLTR